MTPFAVLGAPGAKPGTSRIQRSRLGSAAQTSSEYNRFVEAEAGCPGTVSFNAGPPAMIYSRSPSSAGMRMNRGVSLCTPPVNGSDATCGKLQRGHSRLWPGDEHAGFE